ncbi:BlaI/MecI/CopY family transcriptional regulator [Williamsia sp. 1135]|uniref:BlaI/MecI/CopY family transcriptional regulator n=1 Tax=Williamsia sp. 1135 TaxID=1889262 RepID=UPI000A0F5BCB|nr:BlaI/MecI/CopY family transcriptional regulator [Williamsia sp. 1135]ORM35538.1 penicillinase repressor [Williamsia sp. 1135]
MKQLGTLEADVMDLVWDAAPEQLSVHDILAAMADRQLAYTTILTVVTNLHAKGFLTRTKVSRAYHYTAANTREQVTSQALRDILNSSDDPTAVLMHFARTATPEETDALRKNLPRKARR